MTEDPLRALRVLAGATGEAWLVGGALRDRLLGRVTSDYDVTVAKGAESVARALARKAGGHAFMLSDQFGAWRVVSRERAWQVDLLPLSAETIELDLARRDLTINAIAQPLRGGELIDPLGGLADLRSGSLRMASDEAFAQDALRTIRLPRLACELGFQVEPATAWAAARGVAGLGGVASERVFAELVRIVSADRALDGLELMDALGVTHEVLPELVGLRGIAQSHQGRDHLDVHDPPRAVLAQTIELERDPERVLGVHAAAVAQLLASPLAGGLTRGQALRFGALFHDIAKPQTRGVSADASANFIGHDEAGAQLARVALTRLRAGERVCGHVSALTRHHLRLGFLVHQNPLGRRAIYRYLRSCEPVEVDVTVLSVADRLATLGDGAEEALARHLELARQLLGEALAWRSQRPRPPVRGDRLAHELGLGSGPEIGRILARLEEASFAGEIRTSEEAIEMARGLLDGAAR
ncbi:MAG: HDIG domain-containing metalloprotein [Solirubrobacteraceae bacterium]